MVHRMLKFGLFYLQNGVIYIMQVGALTVDPLTMVELLLKLLFSASHQDEIQSLKEIFQRQTSENTHKLLSSIFDILLCCPLQVQGLYRVLSLGLEGTRTPMQNASVSTRHFSQYILLNTYQFQSFSLRHVQLDSFENNKKQFRQRKGQERDPQVSSQRPSLQLSKIVTMCENCMAENNGRAKRI